MFAGLGSALSFAASIIGTYPHAISARPASSRAVAELRFPRKQTVRPLRKTALRAANPSPRAILATSTPRSARAVLPFAALQGGAMVDLSRRRTILAVAVVALVACGGASTGRGSQSTANSVPKCQPACNGNPCGPDGCGGSCGSCPTGTTCSAAAVCERQMGLITLRYDYVKSPSSCYVAGTTGTCTVTSTVPAADMTGIALAYVNCSVTPSAASLAIDCTGKCSSVSLWCYASSSYAPILSCADPGGTLSDDRLVAGGSWTISYNSGPAIPMLIYGAPECVTAKVGSQGQTPAFFYGSLLNNSFSVVGNGEALGGTLDPATMTITGADVYGQAPYIQSVPFTAVKVR